jgi:hypothetical protein
VSPPMSSTRLSVDAGLFIGSPVPDLLFPGCPRRRDGTGNPGESAEE